MCERRADKLLLCISPLHKPPSRRRRRAPPLAPCLLRGQSTGPGTGCCSRAAPATTTTTVHTCSPERHPQTFLRLGSPSTVTRLSGSFKLGGARILPQKSSPQLLYTHFQNSATVCSHYNTILNLKSLQLQDSVRETFQFLEPNKRWKPRLGLLAWGVCT